MKRLLIVILMMVGMISWQANAVVITFDDLGGSQNPIPNGYAGLNWNNFYSLDPVNYGIPSGYLAGLISAKNVAFNGYGDPALVSDGQFDLISAYLTGVWNNNLYVEVIGNLGGSTLYDNTYILSAIAPTLINFNYLGVDSVQFISSGGTPYWADFGMHFAMDNLVINEVVPEPTTMIAGALLLLPFGASTLRILRKNRKA